MFLSIISIIDHKARNKQIKEVQFRENLRKQVWTGNQMDIQIVLQCIEFNAEPRSQPGLSGPQRRGSIKVLLASHKGSII